MALTAYFNDTKQVLLFKICEELVPLSSADVTPYFNDTPQALLYKMSQLIGGISGGGGTTPGPIPTIATPANATDFSGLPGGVAPPAGEDKIYWAIKDAASYWTIGSGDTQWTEVWKNA